LGFFLDDSGEIQLRKLPGTGGIVAYNLGTDPSGLLLAPATTEFIQVVGTYNVSAGSMELFVNGTSVGTATPGGSDWSGGDGAGIGTMGDVNVGGIGSLQQNTETLNGQVAIFRVYRNQILAQAEVVANFADVTTPETRPPTYINLSPANLATDFFAADDLVASFTEAIALTGGGSITIRNLDTATDTVIPLPDGQVSVAGNQLTINPAGLLAYDTNFAILISPDAIVDTAFTPNAFAGISDPTRWTFRTDPQDLTAPMITSLSPADDATGMQALDSLVVTFDETVLIAVGDITLKNLTDMTEFVISITDSTQVALADNVLTVSPITGLKSDTDYAVQIAGGVVTDISGNPFGGILDDTTWNFTTATYQNVLFADTFNRADSAVVDGTDLNTSGTGKSGLLAPLDWNGKPTRTTPEGSVAILKNQLNIDTLGSSDGNNGGIAWVDNNFTGLSELTVSVDIASTSSSGDGRNPGFGIGQSLAEISGLGGASGPGSVADVYIGWDQVGGTRGLVIWHNGVQQAYTDPGGNAPLTMSATFTFEDMDAGTAINYEVFIGGALVVTGTSAWSGTDENYISIQSNTTNPTAFDNFVVTGTPYTGGADYVAWSGGFPGADLSDPKGDYDGDGLTNNHERLFGLDPTSAASVNPISVPLDAVAGTLSFTRRDDALTGLLSSIETSTDLLVWTKDSGAVLVPGAPINDVETVVATLSADLLTEPKLFVRVVLGHDILAENFEAGDGGFTFSSTAGTDWTHGAPTSGSAGSPNPGGFVDSGNGGSTNCWGTGIGNPGYYDVPTTDSCLRSPNIDLTGVTGAQLTFAEALDLEGSSTTAVLKLRNAVGDVEIMTVYTASDSNSSSAAWEAANGGNPIDLSAGDGQTVYLQWCLSGGSGLDYMGWYIDDVVISAP
jgi:hypothetical protein